MTLLHDNLTEQESLSATIPSDTPESPTTASAGNADAIAECRNTAIAGNADATPESPTTASAGNADAIAECQSPARVRYTLPKEERLCGKKDIDRLIARGRFCEMPGPLRFTFLSGTGSGLNRIMISVPKRSFKRAVKRNLLKRRIRESWRLQKHSLNTTGTDILIMYRSREIRPYRDIYDAVGRIISRINSLNKGGKPTGTTTADNTPVGNAGQPKSGSNGLE